MTKRQDPEIAPATGEGFFTSVVSFISFIAFVRLDEIAGVQGANTESDLLPQIAERDLIAIGLAAYDNPACPDRNRTA